MMTNYIKKGMHFKEEKVEKNEKRVSPKGQNNIT